MNGSRAIGAGALLAALLVAGAPRGPAAGAPTAQAAPWSLGPIAQVIDGDSVFSSLERLDKAIIRQTELEEEAQEHLTSIKVELEALETRRGALSRELAQRRDLIRKRTRALYKYSGRGFLSAVLSDNAGGGQGDLTTLARTRYLLFIVRRDMALIETQKADLEQLEDVKAQLVTRQGEVEAAARQAEVERLRLEQERQRRMALLDRIRKEEHLKARAQRERAAAQDLLAANVTTLGSKAAPAPRATQKPPPAPMATLRPATAPPTSTPSVTPTAEAPSPPPVTASAPPVAEATPVPAIPTLRQPATPPPMAVAALPTSRPKSPAPTQAPPPTPTVAPTPTPTQVRTPQPTPRATAKPQAVASSQAAPPPAPQAKGAFEQGRGRHTFPTTGKVTRAYGRYRVEGMMAPAFSKGVEIVAPTGTPFKAVANGQVQMADWFKGYGLMVIVNHGGDYRSIYTHASRLLVKVGDQVQAGDVIGLVGETGSLKGPYLYLEIRKGTTPINPLEYLAVPPGVMALETP